MMKNPFKTCTLLSRNSIEYLINYLFLIALGFLILLSIPSAVSAQENTIITQGRVNVTFDDVDGYAYRIPADNRSGFFDSPQRLDQTISNILKMKHIVKYGLENKLISDKLLDDKVTERLMSFSTKEFTITDPTKQKDYILFKKFIKLEESYKFMLGVVKSKVNKSELEVLAKEEYKINKSKYHQPEKRDLDYLNINYSNNKDQQKIKAEKILNDILKGKKSIKNISEIYKESEEFNYIFDLNDYAYNPKYTEFSDFIFQAHNTGTIKQLFDAHNRFIIVKINNIKKEHTKSYEEVKESILTKLIKSKVQRDFNSLLGELTSEPVEINKEKLIALRSRYNIK